MRKSAGAFAVCSLPVVGASGSSPTPDARLPPPPRAVPSSALDTVLATLNGRAIREADFRRYLAEAHPVETVASITQTPADRKHALLEYLDFIAISAKAHREGVDREPRVRKATELMEMKLLSQLMTERHRDQLVRDSEVSEEEVRRHYQRRKRELVEEPHFYAHHLLVYVRGNPAFPNQG